MSKKKIIYLINQLNSNLYKIGITKKDPSKRIKELSTGNANELILIKMFETEFDYKLESILHSHYNQYKINSEWFELSTNLVEEFEEICLLYEKNLKLLKKQKNPFI